MSSVISPQPPTNVATDSTLASKWKPLRSWPVVPLLLGMVAARYSTALVEDGPSMLWAVVAFGPLLMSLLIVLWWLIASRARWFERLLGLVGIVGTCFISITFLDKTMIGPAISVLMIPLGVAMFGLGAIICSRWLSVRRTLVAIALAACGFASTTLLRTDGMWGDFAMGLEWRWKPTSEDHIATRTPADAAGATTTQIDAESLLNPQWPSFRGSEGKSRSGGVSLASDWESNPPTQIWKTAIGPGWSSFIVAGDWLFTQEQRGTMECVVCYNAKDGKEIWMQSNESRFDDPLGGPGPRATPTLANGKLFTMGGQGWLMCLNATEGSIVWQKDIRSVAHVTAPMWGFSSSPLVFANTVIVHAGGENNLGLLAFAVDSGELAWSAPCGKDSYSSPQLCMIAGEPTVVMPTNTGMTLLDPKSGEVRLDYDWKVTGYRSLQPQMIDENLILLPSGMGFGTRLVRVEKSGDEYSAKEVWTSRQLKPDFNDFVVYQGHAYGFDALIFTCIDLETGKQKWKGGRYGKGQVLLVEDSGHLLVTSEQGALVLLQADPSGLKELATIQAIEGRTWNHPVLIGNRLYIRNSQEAACFELPTVAPTRPVALLQE